jgi:hypothetical protein
MYANNRTAPQDKSPVGSFWWKDIINLFDNFWTITSCKPNKGDTISFWTQSWATQDQILKERYPQLFSFTIKQKMFSAILLGTRH